MQNVIDAIHDHGPEKCLLIAPRFLAIKQIQRAYARKFGGLSGLLALTPPGALSHFSHVLPTAEKRISDTVAEQLLAESAKALAAANAGEPLYTLLGRQSAVSLALQAFNEIRTAGLQTADLHGAGSRRLGLLAQLFSAYQQRCRELHVTDTVGWMLTAIQHFGKLAEKEPTSIEQIIIYGFPQVQPHYLSLFRALARGLDARVTAWLPGVSDPRVIFAANRELAEKWKEATVIGYAPEVSTGALGHVQRAVFSSSSAPVQQDGTSGIRCITCPERFDEAEQAAILIDELIDRGVQPDEIGLATRDLAGYDQFIRESMDTYQLPYSFRRGKPLLQCAPVRLVMRMTEAGETDELRYDALLAIIQSSYLQLEDTEAFQQQIIDSGVYSAPPHEWPRHLKHATNEQRESLKALLSACSQVTSKKAKKQMEAVLALITAFIRPTLTDTRNTSDRPAAQAIRQLREIIGHLLKDLEVLEEMGLTGERNALEMLRQEVTEANLNVEQDPRRAVAVFSLFDIGYVQPRHLIIIGMDENTLPGSQNRATLLDEESIAALAGQHPGAGQFLRSRSQRREQEEQAFVLAVGAARESLTCIRARLDADGGQLFASSYYDEILRLSGTEEESRDGGDTRSIPDTQPEAGALRRQFARTMYRHDLPDTGKLPAALYNAIVDQPLLDDGFINHLAALVDVEARRRDGLICRPEDRPKRINRWCGRISRPQDMRALRRWILQEHGHISYSSFNMAFNSPFGFFMRYLLRCEALEMPQQDLTPMQKGAVVHTALEKVFLLFKGQTPPPETEGFRMQVKEAVDAVFNMAFGHRFTLRDNYPSIALLYANTLWIVDGVLADARNGNLITDELEYKVMGGSLSFHENASLPLFARIDRLDRQGDTRIIIDYKYRSSSPNLTRNPDDPTEKDMQLPFYLMAMHAVEGIPLEALRAGYYQLRNLERVEIDHIETGWSRLFKPSKEKPEQTLLEATISRTYAALFEGLFPLSDREDARVYDEIRFVGRWFELPPEVAGGRA